MPAFLMRFLQTNKNNVFLNVSYKNLTIKYEYMKKNQGKNEDKTENNSMIAALKWDFQFFKCRQKL